MPIEGPRTGGCACMHKPCMGSGASAHQSGVLGSFVDDVINNIIQMWKQKGHVWPVCSQSRMWFS